MASILLDAEDSSLDVPNMEKLRDAFLDTLGERAHDVSPFTRSAVLKTWRDMVEANVLPVQRVAFAAEIAADRYFNLAK